MNTELAYSSSESCSSRNYLISFAHDTVRQGAYLDESFSGLEEMLFSLRFGTLCVPVDDCLIGNTVRVVQHLE
jgi:hypothetical protein